MNTTMTIPTTTQMTIEVTDSKVVTHIKALLKQINAVKSIKVTKVKSEVEQSLEEAHNGNVTTWNSVDDYFKTMLSK